jgi:transposase
MDRNGVVASSMKPGSYKAVDFAQFLGTLPVGKRILLDNASIHRAVVVREVARQRQQTLVFTPPYCPWFNPVEHGFSVMKAYYRRKRVLSQNPFEEDVKECLSKLTSSICDGCFRGAFDSRKKELVCHSTL